MLDVFSVVVLHRSIVYWRSVVLGTWAFCYMWNLFAVVVFQRSIVNWRWPWYMCILLSVKLIWCSIILYMYGQSEGEICPNDMCILLYVKIIWCIGITDIYGDLGVWDICPNDMCILVYVKLIWCSGFPWIYGRLEGVVLPADLPSLVLWYSGHLCFSEGDNLS